MEKINFEDLFRKRLGTIKPGLERMKEAYEFLAMPSLSAQNILVAGTNGKGGTSGFLWSFLAHESAGLFTSPHLRSFAERMQVSKQVVCEDDLALLGGQIKASLGPLYEQLSFFEMATLMAYKIFEDRGTDFNVMEVGLGGRWDCTNIVEPSVSVVTSISRDHEEFLGSDLLGILKEKLGVSRPGVPLFWGDAGEISQLPEARVFLKDYVEKNGIPLFSWGEHFGEEGDNFYLALEGNRDSQPFPPVLRTAPAFIKRNFVMAAAVYSYLSQKNQFSQDWRKRLSSFPYEDESAPNSLVARFQRLTLEDNRVIFDVCHNPDGMRQVVKNIKSKEASAKTAMISILKDKKFDEILDLAKECFSNIYLFAISHDRGFSKSDLAMRHQDLEFFDTFSSGWALVKERLGDEPVLICGSVLAVGQVFEEFKLDPQNFTSKDVLSGTWV